MRREYHATDSVAICPITRAAIKCNRRSWQSFQRGRRAAVTYFEAHPYRRHVLLPGEPWEYSTLSGGSDRAALAVYEAKRVTMACALIPGSGTIVRRIFPDNTPLRWRLEGERVAELLFRIAGYPLARRRWGTAEDRFAIGAWRVQQ